MTEPREWPPDEADRPSPLSVVGPVLRRWPLLLVLAVAGGSAGYGGYTWQTPVYESSARLQVSKRFAAGDRGVFLEDYVATMTQLIASDAVLGKTARILAAVPLDAPLPADETAAIDALKRLVIIARVRDPAAAVTATSTSSVLSLRCVAGDGEDSRRILLAVLEAVQWYLVTRHDDAHTAQLADLDRALAARAADRRGIEETLARKARELSAVTDEELVAVRDRLTANSQRGFALQLELIAMDRELKAIADTGPSAEEREAKRRLLLPQAGAPAEAAPADGPEVILKQLVAARADLGERLVAGHPRLVALDAQIEHFRGLATRPAAPAAPVDELRRHELRLRERKAVAELQRDRIEARVAADTDTLRKGGALQEKIDALRRQLDEDAAETHRQRDRRSALATAKDSSRAYEAQVLDQPRAGRKVDPARKVWVQAGLGLGLAVGVVLTFLAELLDQSYRSPADIRRRLGVPVFGHVPHLRLDPPAGGPAEFDPVLVTAMRPRSMEAEVYRVLRTRVLVATSTADYRVVQVTSPNPGDGKSTTAANLAVTLAQAGKRVLLMDCDFRRPRVHTLFALADPHLGLTAVTAGTADLADAVRPCAVPNLFLLPSGPAVDSPADLLAGARFAAVLAGLRERFDHIVIDSPPLFAVSDSLVLARCVDAVLLVFGEQSRSRAQTLRAKEQLTDTGVVVLGVVVNGMAEPASRYGGYSYGKYGKYGKYEHSRYALPPAAAEPPTGPIS